MMTDHDRAAARREITNAFMNALERRHEVLDLIVDADDRPSAVDGIVELLGTSRLGAEAVIGMSFDQLTKDSRKIIAAELEDLNNILSFTFKDRPASSGDSMVLRPFSAKVGSRHLRRTHFGNRSQGRRLRRSGRWPRGRDPGGTRAIRRRGSGLVRRDRR